MPFGDNPPERKSSLDKFIESSRNADFAKETLTERAPELRGELEADRVGKTTIEPKRHLGDEKFETFKETAKNADFLRYDRQKKTNVVKSDEVPDTKRPPDPRTVNESRSEFAQRMDEQRDARVTVDPSQYASDPDSFDFPGVDSGPKLDKLYGTPLTDSDFQKIEDRIEDSGPFNPDNLF